MLTERLKFALNYRYIWPYNNTEKCDGRFTVRLAQSSSLRGKIYELSAF